VRASTHPTVRWRWIATPRVGEGTACA